MINLKLLNAVNGVTLKDTSDDMIKNIFYTFQHYRYFILGGLVILGIIYLLSVHKRKQGGHHHVEKDRKKLSNSVVYGDDYEETRVAKLNEKARREYERNKIRNEMK